MLDRETPTNRLSRGRARKFFLSREKLLITVHLGVHPRARTRAGPQLLRQSGLEYSAGHMLWTSSRAPNGNAGIHIQKSKPNLAAALSPRMDRRRGCTQHPTVWLPPNCSGELLPPSPLSCGSVPCIVVAPHSRRWSRCRTQAASESEESVEMIESDGEWGEDGPDVHPDPLQVCSPCLL